MSFILGFFKGAWGYIAAGGAALVAILVAMGKAKQAGKNEVIVKTKEKEVENVKKAAKVERELATTSSDAKRKRLRDKWTVG